MINEYNTDENNNEKENDVVENKENESVEEKDNIVEETSNDDKNTAENTNEEKVNEEKEEKKVGFFKRIYNKVGKRNLIIICSASLAVITAVAVTSSVVCCNNSRRDNNTQISTSNSGSNSGNTSSGNPSYGTDSDGIAFTENADGSEYEITGIGSCTDKDVVFPAQYNGKNVTSVGKLSFAFTNDITSVTIPNTVKSIGDGAFTDCPNLKTIIFKGTKDEWNKITKGKNWDYNLTGLVIKCTDGDINNESTAKASVGLVFEASADSKGYLLAGIGTCTDDILYVPSEYEGKHVIGVKSQAFFDSTTNDTTIGKVVAISLPDSITSIESYAFTRATSLEKILLPNTLVSIGDVAFYETTALKSISFPSSLRTIEANAFTSCGLEKVVLPEGLTSLGTEAFAWSESIKSVTLPTTITNFGDDDTTTRGSSDSNDTFFGCENLVEIILPEGITKLGTGMFGRCTSLEEVSIPSTLTVIPEYLFTNCFGLKKITLHSALTKLEKFSFNNVSVDDIIFDGSRAQWKTILDTSTAGTSVANIFGLNTCYVVHCTDDSYFIDVDTYYNMQQEESTKIDDTTGIYNGVLSDNSDWAKLVIPSTVNDSNGTALTMVETCEATFAGLKTLTTVSIPNTIKKLGKSMFAGCENLTRVLYDGTYEEWRKISQGDNCFYGIKKYTLYCTDGDHEITNGMYSNPYYSENLTFEEQGNTCVVSGIGTCSDNCIFIPKEYNGKSVTGVKTEAFLNNTSIKCVILPDTVTIIGESAFKGCTSLRTAYLPSSLTAINSNSFEGSGIKDIVIPENVATISMYAFKDCGKLKTVTINSKTFSMGTGVFNGCSITDITFAGTKQEWKNMMGTNTTWIDSSSQGFTVTCSDGLVFDNVNVTSNLTYVQNTDDENYTISSFTGTSGVKALIIPSTYSGKKVTKIGENAFKDKRFDMVVIPDSITYIAKGAFEEFTVAGKFCFNGTIEEWNKIEKDADWKKGSTFTVVVCSDGEVTIK